MPLRQAETEPTEDTSAVADGILPRAQHIVEKRPALATQQAFAVRQATVAQHGDRQTLAEVLAHLSTYNRAFEAVGRICRAYLNLGCS